MVLKVAEEHTQIPRVSLKEGNATCAKIRVTTASFTVQNYRSMFPEDWEPSLSPRKSASIVFPLPDISQLVFILSQETKMTGYVSKVRSVLYSVTAKIMTTWNGSIKDLKNG